MVAEKLDFARFVPRFLLADPNGYALTQAIGWALGELLKDTAWLNRVLVPCNETPDWLLDEMAWELGMDPFEVGTTQAQKVAMLLTVGSVNSRMGTAYAVRTAMHAVTEGSALQEHKDFTATVYVSDPAVMADARLRRWVMLAAERAKNVRTHLVMGAAVNQDEPPQAYAQTMVQKAGE